VRPEDKIGLAGHPTRVQPVYRSKKKYRKLLQKHVGKLSSLQRLHYASNRYALLFIFQGMDAAGKEGSIWYIVPADDKKNARPIVSQIVLDTLAGLRMAYPRATDKNQRELKTLRGQLRREDSAPSRWTGVPRSSSRGNTPGLFLADHLASPSGHVPTVRTPVVRVRSDAPSVRVPRSLSCDLGAGPGACRFRCHGFRRPQDGGR
jgi:hypothetical protein